MIAQTRLNAALQFWLELGHPKMTDRKTTQRRILLNLIIYFISIGSRQQYSIALPDHIDVQFCVFYRALQVSNKMARFPRRPSSPYSY
jgi:hypothetical protein